VSAERAGTVVEVIDKLAKSDRTKKKAVELRELLNKNIKGAFNKVVTEGYIKVEAKKKKNRAGKKPDGAQTKDKVGVGGGPGADLEKHDEALESADTALIFLKGREASKLN